MNKHTGVLKQDYKKVYEFDKKTDNMNTISIADEIFKEFNINRPSDFKGHSLSPSDIIKIDDTIIRCDPIGWTILK